MGSTQNTRRSTYLRNKHLPSPVVDTQNLFAGLAAIIAFKVARPAQSNGARRNGFHRPNLANFATV